MDKNKKAPCWEVTEEPIKYYCAQKPIEPFSRLPRTKVNLTPGGDDDN